MKISNIFALFLENAARQIRNEDCSITEDEMEQIYIECKKLMNGTVSKQEACKMLNVSRATFDRIVRTGKLPKGHSKKGSHELFWYKETISAYKNEHNE